jgi:hypothetical protein
MAGCQELQSDVYCNWSKTEANFSGEDKQMTTSNSNRQTSNWQHNAVSGVTATEGSRVAQFIDYTNMEESYELLPSGD